MAKPQQKSDVIMAFTLDQWRSDVDHVRWARSEPRFQLALLVMRNELMDIMTTCNNYSESRALGKHEGFIHAIRTLEKLMMTPDKMPVPFEAEYREKQEYQFAERGPRD